MEWLQQPEYDSPDKLGLEYGEFIATVDRLLMGRKTFEKVLSFPTWPYEDVKVVVLSRIRAPSLAQLVRAREIVSKLEIR